MASSRSRACWSPPARPAPADTQEGTAMPLSETQTETQMLQDLTEKEYKYGFVTEIEEERVPPGLSEDVIRLISGKKNEPAWMLEWRLSAYRHWLTMTEPTWAHVHYPK